MPGPGELLLCRAVIHCREDYGKIWLGLVMVHVWCWSHKGDGVQVAGYFIGSVRVVGCG